MYKLIQTLFVAACLACATSLSSWAQDPDLAWVNGVGSAIPDFTASVQYDAQGGALSTGYFYQTVDFDPGPGNASLTSAGGNDVFIQRHNAAGALLWVKRVGSNGNDQGFSTAFDAAGNIYVAGRFAGTVDFDPGAGTAPMTSAGFQDAFLLKLDGAGNFVWVKTFGGSGDDAAYGLAVNAGGQVVSTGYFSGTADLDPGASVHAFTSAGGKDIFVLKLDAAGGYVWADGIGGIDEDEGHIVQLDGIGNVHLVGLFRQTVDFDPQGTVFNLTSAGLDDYFVLKLNAAGNLRWAKGFGSAGAEAGNSIALDSARNVYVTGTFLGTVDFDPSPGGTQALTAQSTSYGDIFVQKLDSAGQLIWVKAFLSATTDAWAYANSVVVDTANNVYVGGTFSKTVDFDPGPSTYNLTSVFSNANIAVVRLDASGGLVWARALGGAECSVYCLSIDIELSLFGAGYYNGNVDFDPNPTSYVPAVQGGGDLFVFKWSQCHPTFAHLTVTSCNNYVLNGQTFTSSGTYTQTRTNVGGCDSTITLTLTIQHNSTSTLSASTCDTFSLNGTVYNSPGTYHQTLTNSLGCDSIITLILTRPNTTSTLTVSSCWAYDFNGSHYTSSGTYTHVIPNAAGCDSTITLQLTILTFMTSVSQTGQVISAFPYNLTNAYQWLDCNNGYAVLPGATSANFTPGVAGTYACMVTQGGCIDTTACFVFTPIGFEESLGDQISLYPNPCNARFALNLESLDAVTVAVQVYDAQGKLVWMRDVLGGVVQVIDLGAVSDGVYVVRIGSRAMRVVVAR